MIPNFLVTGLASCYITYQNVTNIMLMLTYFACCILCAQIVTLSSRVYEVAMTVGDNPTTDPTANPTIIPTNSPVISISSIIPTIATIPTVYPSSQPENKITTYDLSTSPSNINYNVPTSDPTTMDTVKNMSYNYNQVLDILINSTVEQTNHSNSLMKNIIVQNKITTLLKQVIDWIITSDEMSVGINKIWYYNGSMNSDCQLRNTDSNIDIDIDNTELYEFYLTWVRFDVYFADSITHDEWESELSYTIDLFSNQLAQMNYFINDTVSVYYCDSLTASDNDKNNNYASLTMLSILGTFCIMVCFIGITICACVDATVFRRNEISVKHEARCPSITEG